MTFCMTSSSFVRPWVQLSVSKTQKPFLVLEYFLTLNSSTSTNSDVHENASPLRCLITPLNLYIVLALSSVVNNLSHKALIFHYFQGPTIKFHDFPGLENEILKFHDFPGFPWPVRTLIYIHDIICYIVAVLQGFQSFDQFLSYL